MRRKSGLLLFLTACIPGCGQMYQGYMKRGVSLLSMSCLLVLLAAMSRGGELVLFLPVLWLYAFFDTYNIRAGLDAGTAPEDAYLVRLLDADQKRLRQLLRRRHSLLGWGLVIAGVYGLLSELLDAVRGLLPDWLYWSFREDVPRVVLLLAIIALGVWFIRGPRQPQEENFVPFTPEKNSAEENQEDDIREDAGGDEDSEPEFQEADHVEP